MLKLIPGSIYRVPHTRANTRCCQHKNIAIEIMLEFCRPDCSVTVENRTCIYKTFLAGNGLIKLRN
jgi:hypothetical protein